MATVRKATAVFLSAVLLSLSVFSLFAYASTVDIRYFERGILNDGDNPTYYIIDKDNKTLYITGNGYQNAMTLDYPSADGGPFAGRTDITRIVIEEDVARIGDYVCANLKKVDTLEIQSNLLSSSSSMSAKAMIGCTALRNVQGDSAILSTNALLAVLKGALGIATGSWGSVISNGVSLISTGVNGDGSLDNEVVHAMVNDYIMTGEEIFFGDLDQAVADCQAREQETCYWENAYHHQYNSFVSAAPSCTADGEMGHVCSVCGKHYYERYGSPLGHDYVYETLYENSCVKEGISKGICSRCGDVQYQAIPASGHTDGYWNMTSIPAQGVKGTIQCTCLDCGEALRTTDISIINSTAREFKVGIDPSSNTVEGVITPLMQIGYSVDAVKDGAILSGSEKIGTGCMIYTSNAVGHMVHRIDTVVLYGDVDGDGIIGNSDYQTLLGYTMGNTGLLPDGSVFRRAADLNDDGVVDAFDLSLLDLQIAGYKALDQSKPQN